MFQVLFLDLNQEIKNNSRIKNLKKKKKLEEKSYLFWNFWNNLFDFFGFSCVPNGSNC
jgi:hypothetical protein